MEKGRFLRGVNRIIYVLTGGVFLVFLAGFIVGLSSGWDFAYPVGVMILLVIGLPLGFFIGMKILLGVVVWIVGGFMKDDSA